MPLSKSHIIRLECDADGDIPGLPCKFRWEGTQRELDEILHYEETSQVHFITKNDHQIKMAIKNNQCPWCLQREKSRKDGVKERNLPGGLRRDRPGLAHRYK